LVGLLALLAPSALAQGRTPLVTVGRAERAPVVQEVPVTGTVATPRIARISAEVSGRVDAMAVDVGDRVEAGARIATLDAELARIALRRARAATREAEAALADARRRLADAERLSQENAIAATALRALQAEVDMDEAAVARFAAEESRQAALVARHRVEAPFAGAVSQRFAAPGEWIEPGTPFVELVSTDDLRIDFQVPQEYYPQVARGDHVEVSLDAAPDRVFEGRVASTVPRSESGARTFLMLVRLADGEVPMIPGMSARARLRLGAGREGVIVSRDALLRHPDGRVTVWVLDGSAEGGAATVSERRVEPGRAFDGRVEIVDGLEAGSSVVLLGNEGLSEGQRVRVRRDGR
jgi:RND family efflux transporter MFP subunit